MARKTLTLLPKIGRRAERGHAWVFANEVAELIGNPQPGEEVVVRSAKGLFLGMALFSLSSLIRARIYSRVLDQPCDEAFLRERLGAAQAYRRRLYGGALPPSYRLIHGEGDGLPGLVVDVFGVAGQAPTVVIQLTTAGMEQRRDVLLSALRELLQPVAIVERSDVAVRELEGLAPRKEVAWGDLQTPWALEENGTRMLADLLNGQKTGYFLDQAGNRAWARQHMKGARVLDMFCYVGAWSMTAAGAGARKALGIDSSGPALALARQAAAALPAEVARPEFVEADAFTWLHQAADAAVSEHDLYDVVIVDPPALAKSKKDAVKAFEAYRELNFRAMQLLAPDGLLIACSCSHHIAKADFRELLTLAARDAARVRLRGSEFTLEYEADQAPDHPIPLATPEAAYLKCCGIRRRF